MCGSVARGVAHHEVVLAAALLRLGDLRRAEGLRLRVLAVALVQPGAEGTPAGAGALAGRVELDVDAVDVVLDELDDGLVVRVRDGHPRHALVLVLLLLALEDRREEELLQLLVGEVDAQLLEEGWGRGRVGRWKTWWRGR